VHQVDFHHYITSNKQAFMTEYIPSLQHTACVLHNTAHLRSKQVNWLHSTEKQRIYVAWVSYAWNL